MARKTDDEILERISTLEKRYYGFSERTRMSVEGAMLDLRLSELKWVLGE